MQDLSLKKKFPRKKEDTPKNRRKGTCATDKPPINTIDPAEKHTKQS